MPAVTPAIVTATGDGAHPKHAFECQSSSLCTIENSAAHVNEENVKSKIARRKHGSRIHKPRRFRTTQLRQSVENEQVEEWFHHVHQVLVHPPRVARLLVRFAI